MTTYAIIPARGGSVRIPHKNIVPLRGRPLIEYTIRAAQESKCLERIIVSTDCCQTANIAAALDAQVVMRPGELADGTKHPSKIAAHCMESLPKPDAVMWLQPTSPLRKPEWIREAIAMMESEVCDSVVSYVRIEEAQLKYLATVGGDKLISPCASDIGDRALYTRSGDIYLTKSDVLLSCDLYGQDSRALIIPRDRYCNVNEPVDLKIAEALL